MGEFANRLSIVEVRGHDHFEPNEFAPFKAADAAPEAPTGEQQVAPAPGSVSKMLLNAKQQKGSRLMSLPAEVRNCIYALALPGPLVALHITGYVDPPNMTKTPSILLACKRTYREAIGIYYSTTLFLYGSIWSGLRPTCNKRLRQWLTCIGHERVSQIKNIWTSAKRCRDVDMRKGEAYHANQIEACLEDIDAVRRLAEDIYGRSVLGPEVVKGCFELQTWHGYYTIWTSDPRRLHRDAFAAYDEVSLIQSA